jgi:hypothetical protein
MAADCSAAANGGGGDELSCQQQAESWCSDPLFDYNVSWNTQVRSGSGTRYLAGSCTRYLAGSGTRYLAGSGTRYLAGSGTRYFVGSAIWKLSDGFTVTGGEAAYPNQLKTLPVPVLKSGA